MTRLSLVIPATEQQYIDLRKQVTDTFKQLVIDALMLEITGQDIENDTPLFGLGLGLDSIDILELVVGIERHFGITVTDENMAAFRSVNTVVDFVLSHPEFKGMVHHD